MSAPVNITGTAHLGYIAYSWRIVGVYAFDNDDAGPGPFVFPEDGGTDGAFDGGEPARTELLDGTVEGNSEPYARAFEVEVYGDAAHTDLLASALVRGTTYRISVPDDRLTTTHYLRVRSLTLDNNASEWAEADPVQPYRFPTASKPGGGQLRIAAGDVSPNSLDGSSLANTLAVGTAGFNTLVAQADRTLAFTRDGLRLTDSGSTVVELPTDANSNASFSGDVVASSLVSKSTVLRNATTAPISSVHTLASGRYSNPVVAPNVRNQYPWSRDLPTAGGWGLFLDGAGGAGGADRTAWLTNFPNAADTVSEYFIGSGMGEPYLLRSITVSGAEVHAVTRVNGLIVLLYARNGTYYIAPYNRATLAPVGAPVAVSVNCYEPALLTDFTNTASQNLVFLVDTATTGAAPTAFRWRHYEITQATGALTLRATVTSTGTLPRTLAPTTSTSLTGTTTVNPSTTTTTAYLSVPDTSAERVFKFTITRNSTTKYATAVAYTSGNDSNFEAAWGGAPWGWSYDTLTGLIAVISGADSAVWETSTSTSITSYTHAYAWAYENGAIKYATLPSPGTAFARVPFTSVYVDVPDPADDPAYAYPPNYAYVYADNKRQSDVTLNTIAPLDGYTTSGSYATAFWDTYDTAGAAPSASNTFPASGGTPAVIKSETAGWAFYGDGTYTGITSVPTGAITAYAGVADPAGWLICDGRTVSRATYATLWNLLRNGTTSSPYGNGDGTTTFNLPDLRQRFPLGKAASGTGATLGGTGGSIDHGHGFAGSGSGSHSHGDTFSVSEGSTGTHVHNAGTLAAAGHSHGAGTLATGNPDSLVTRGSATTNAAGPSHGHTISGSTGSASPGVSGDTGTQGSGHGHSPSIAGSVSSASVSVSVSGTTDPTNPPYLVVNYIIKT